MSQCFVQWRVPILVWYVQIRTFPYQQLQKDILQISTVLRVGSTAVVSSSATEQSARVLWEVLLCCWVSSSRCTAGSQTAWSWDEGVMILYNVTTTHWKTQHHILQQCHCNYFKYQTVLSVTKSLNFWWQRVPFEHDCEVTAQYYTLSCPHKNMYSLKCTALLCVSYRHGSWSVTQRL